MRAGKRRATWYPMLMCGKVLKLESNIFGGLKFKT